MKILLEIPDEKAPDLMEVLNDISYVKTTVPSGQKKRSKKLRQAVEEVKLVQAGKLKARPAGELLDEL